MIGTVLVVLYVGLKNIKKDDGSASPSTPAPPPVDQFHYVLAACDRIERDMHARFDRIEVAARDINRDVIELRNYLATTQRRDGNKQ